MDFILAAKSYLVAAVMLLIIPVGHATDTFTASLWNTGSRIGAAMQDGVSRHIRVANITVPISPDAPQKHVRLDADKKSPVEQKNTFAELPTVTSMSFTVGNPNPFQKPKKTTLSSSPTPSPSSQAKPKPKPLPTVLPAATYLPAPSPSPTPQPVPSTSEGSSAAGQAPSSQQIDANPSPNFEVGTILIGNNPQTVKANSVVEFTVFVRNASGAAVKNTSLNFLVNGVGVTAQTNDTGNALLKYQLPDGAMGKFDITVKLGSQSASFSVTIVDTKPVLSLSSFAFTLEGYHVRLRNALAEYVPNWSVTAYKRDGSVLATMTTNELGVIEFPLPPRENGGHLYACAEVKDVGKQCTEW